MAFILAVLFGLVSLAAIGGAPISFSIGIISLHLIVLIALIAIVRLLITLPFDKEAEKQSWFLRNSFLRRAAKVTNTALKHIGENKALFAQIVIVQIVQRCLDGLTLWCVFLAIGHNISFAACFVGISLASLAATLAPTPMGMGSFEGGLVATLAAFGVSLEAALTATVLYRGLSLWLPMLPGFFIIQHEMFKLKKGGTSRRSNNRP